MTTDFLALDFKSATLYAVRVVLHRADLAALTAALDKRMQDAGSFFANEPVVIDASRVDCALDWTALVAALGVKNLPVIGVITHPANADGALAAGLVSVELSTLPARPAQNNATVTAEALEALVPAQTAAGIDMDLTVQPDASPLTPAARPSQAASALVITKPLRSGQRVYARHTDLIIIGMVSQGAEVIADGNIHVYGPLRGKAMAGARGDTAARIFTTELDAELLAIAGVYRVVEARLDADLRNRPALVHLKGDTLQVESLKP
jgi:septum site-determining protein MinC